MDAKPPRLAEGRPFPMGATPQPGGTNFALFSANATAVELCLFDHAGQRELRRLPMPARTDEVWHGFLPGAGPGLVYGYRVHGPWAPAEGHRFNSSKLMLDPYARRHLGAVTWAPELCDYPRETGDTAAMDGRDNAPFVPKSVVEAPRPPPPPLPNPIPWDRTVLYETHVRGLTRLHPDVPEARRGTYAGLAAPEMVSHMVALGVTAVELLPIHSFLSEPALVARGLSNFWGYNTLGFFAPERGLASDPDDAAAEFRATVAALHAAGLEVVLDMVYNHTCEADELGPSLCFKGIDNSSYYRLDQGGARYVNDTGCGNTVNLDHPRVLQLVMDSLRFWATEMGVDGFRFDLAPVLGRTPRGFETGAGFFGAVRQDPALQGVKLMAEAWDIGPGGYRVGEFPPGWSEWNDKFRDDARAFWAGAPGLVPALASRMSGSTWLFNHRGRRPWAGINFVAVHDGFTLRDVVSYGRKHNEANGEDGRDGSNNNNSDNHGTEGPTDDPAIEAARWRTARNLHATLLLSQGTPLILAGDEFGRTQGGNNNAYCQDNPVSWADWDWSDAGRAHHAFVTRLLRLRADHPVLRRPRFFTGETVDGSRDADWIHPRGTPMVASDWSDTSLRCFGLLLDGRAPSGGEPGDTLFVLLNAGAADVLFDLPLGPWSLLLHTAEADPVPDPGHCPLPARSLVVLRREETP